MCIRVSLPYFFFFKQKTAYEIMPSLVGSEMCIRDRYQRRVHGEFNKKKTNTGSHRKMKFFTLALVLFAFVAIAFAAVPSGFTACPGGKYACPSGNTCAKTYSGGVICCPHQGGAQICPGDSQCCPGHTNGCVSTYCSVGRGQSIPAQRPTTPATKIQAFYGMNASFVTVRCTYIHSLYELSLIHI
eukprot:TRINITY_DN7937_c0_g2_i2.p1 TRINITY_DN7937_c0_g2~~TRINITY_DN7937_c0_g2_i2.p1  ORF type:complete len:199 (-),score=74.30 TRINITY_DN7937_c0_g2_i2:51-608(-)